MMIIRSVSWVQKWKTNERNLFKTKESSFMPKWTCDDRSYRTNIIETVITKSNLGENFFLINLLHNSYGNDLIIRIM